MPEVCHHDFNFAWDLYTQEDGKYGIAVEITAWELEVVKSLIGGVTSMLARDGIYLLGTKQPWQERDTAGYETWMWKMQLVNQDHARLLYRLLNQVWNRIDAAS